MCGGSSQKGGNVAFVNPYVSNGGAGGSGSQWVDGIFYAGGGGGPSIKHNPPYYYPGGLGGPGGGGNGGNDFNDPTGSAGTPNTGGGGGGSFTSFPGGSGVVKIRYAGAPAAQGGIITQSGSYTYHTFISGAGSFTY